MSPADAVAAIMFAAVILYAVFGGADFGSGVWDLTAGNAERGARLRRLIDHAIGPVWEANHVWLIFVLVLLWSGFPEPFTDLMRTLAIPLWLAGLGIVLRGAAFAFRKYSPTLRWAQTAGVVFAASSLLTPFFLGAIAGAVASGRVPADGSAGLWTSWLSATSILGGILAIATCTFMAGLLLAAEAETLGDHDLAEELRERTLIGGVITGAIAVAGIPILVVDDETLVDGLLGRGLPVILASGIAGLLTLRLLQQRRLRHARISGAIAVATVVAGWGVAQYPWILVDQTEIADGAGARSTLIALLIASGLAAVLVVPPLLLLYRLADTNIVGEAKSSPSSTEA